jgi:hypothetical protein
MVGIKTTGEQISILCHNGTIFDKRREKTGLAIKRHVGVREQQNGGVLLNFLLLSDFPDF